MTATSPSRILADQNTGGANKSRDLALKLFAGTVYEAFTNKTAFFDNTGNILAQKTITGGHEYQWPIMGDDSGIAPTWHNPGALMVDGAIKMMEGVVRVDDILVSHIDVPFADLDLAQYSVLGPFATKLGRTLAIEMDKKIAIMGVKAARTAAVSGIHAGGKVVQRDDGVTGTSETPSSITAAYPNSSVGSGRFRDDVAELAQKFDEDNVPEDGRYLFVSPYIRTIMRHEGATWAFGAGTLTPNNTIYSNAGNIYSKEMTSQPWDVNTRVFGMLEGFNLVLTNHLPTADTSYSAGDSGSLAITKYNIKADGLDDDNDGDGEGGYSAAEAKANAKPAALAMCAASEGAASVGLVQAGGIRTHMESDERRNTQFLKAQMHMGADVLCPWTAGYIGIYT
tara:strand:+ start:1621 stop:2808 length:1188 start_codon:yes stop_codon:yes gene_type:complete